MSDIRDERKFAWDYLQTYAQEKADDLNLMSMFAQDPGRFVRFSFTAPGIFADLSKQHVNEKVFDALLALVHASQIEIRRNAMFLGDVINRTEGRCALHTALRGGQRSPFKKEIQTVLDDMLIYAEEVREARHITDIVCIGIGGSDLGARMAVQALASFAHPGKRLHFVSNIDGFDLSSVLADLTPKNTLFIITSKTFTTSETLANANCAKIWAGLGGVDNIADHFVAVTANAQLAQSFGIEHIFEFWDWVGGRYSIWSAVGLPLAIAIGEVHFQSFLMGAQRMDEHFLLEPLERNLPVLLALTDIWNRDFLHRTSRCVVPYHQGLSALPAYLQQLEMESNGKRVDMGGHTLDFPTAGVVWGEAGTNAQHAFFQMLHQGTDIIPVDFIIFKNPVLPGKHLPRPVLNRLKQQQSSLIASALAQSRALMIGKPYEQALRDCEGKAPSTMDAATLAHHRTFPGNRPSTTLLLESLNPENLGSLLALHEHRAFTCGVIWGIDSFDQWGVELGKTLANDLLPRLDSGDTQTLDPSTAGLISWLNK